MDQIIGVPTKRAAEIIGVPASRLKRWEKTGLVLPSTRGKVGNRNYWSYSLDDLVEGKVVREIEDRGVHVRSLRRFVESLRSELIPHPLCSLEWGVENREVFAKLDGGWLGGRRPEQFVLAGTIDIEEIRVAARRAATERVGAAGAVEHRRAVLGSKDVFAGTRIPVASVQTYLRHGFSPEQILEEYPALEVADVQEARRRLAS